MKKQVIILLSTLFIGQLLAQKKPNLSDAEVAFIAVTANQIDIAYADIAKQKSKDPEVLKFAETMQRDHRGVIDQAVALAKKLGVNPLDNAVSKKLVADSETTKKDLLSRAGKSFDKAYIDNEVGYHKAVIQAVEDLLIPETENGELKKLLDNVLPALRLYLLD